MPMSPLSINKVKDYDELSSMTEEHSTSKEFYGFQFEKKLNTDISRESFTF